MVISLKSGYQSISGLSHILNFAVCTCDQVDQVATLTVDIFLGME